VGIEACFSGPPLFGGDQHYPVGPPGTVNGRGIRVLQYLDTLDIIRIDGIERANITVKDIPGHINGAQGLGTIWHPIYNE